MRRFLTWLAVALAILAVAGTGVWLLRTQLIAYRLGLPTFTHSPGVDRQERVAMRDGVHLDTRVLIPAGDHGTGDGDEAWPTVLIRDPYSIPDTILCDIFVRFGYACVHQIVRGRFGSEGEWVPVQSERNDGLDTLEWLVRQPWQDGNIAMYGLSYLSMVQWVVADAAPPELKTLVASVFGTNSHDILYERGMFRHEIWTAWASLMHGREMTSGGGDVYQRAIRYRPHSEADVQIMGRRIPWYRDWIDAARSTHPLWTETDYHLLTSMPGRVRVPILMFGGWHDPFIEVQLRDFHRLATREHSKLVVGPWIHTLTTAGDLEHPNDIGSAGQWERILDWLGHHLRGEPLDQPEGVVEVYSMGDDQWTTWDEWPPHTLTTRFHLGAAAESPTCDGGTLANRPPAAPQTVRYFYDPENPVPTRGGAGLLAFLLPGFEGAPPAAVDQAGLCERGDVLTFVSDPLQRPLRIAGSAKVTLTVSSDAPDTAFTAKLIEVGEDGRAINVRDGITSLAFRDGAARRESYEPGERVEVEIDLWPIDWVLARNSKLRLDVSSSNFPAYHAHPNRAGPWAQVADTTVAQQTLYVGDGASAYVEVPLRAPPRALARRP